MTLDLDPSPSWDAATHNSPSRADPGDVGVRAEDLIRRVFRELDATGAGWLVLRGEDDLLDAAGDVDLLVEAPRLARMEAGLASLGFVRIPTAGRGSHRIHVGYDRRRAAWLKLDLVTELAFGPYFMLRAPLERECLQRRRVVRGVPVPVPDDAFWTLMLHCLLDKRCISERHATQLRALANDAASDGPWNAILRPWHGHGSPTVSIIRGVAAGDWDRLLGFGPAIERRWLRREPVRALARWSMGWVGRRLEPLRQRTRRGGVSIALLGLDGAGKSRLAAELAGSFPLPARVVYMGPWRRSLSSAGSRIPGLNLAQRLVIVWRAYLVGRWHRTFGRLVVFDRYVYDAQVDSRLGHPWRDRVYHAIVARACPEPDRAFVLDVTGNVAFARKGEHDPATLEARRQGYLRLAQDIPRVLVVNANRPLQDVVNELTAQAWDVYADRSRRATG